jgi:hypothetical protein
VRGRCNSESPSVSTQSNVFFAVQNANVQAIRVLPDEDRPPIPMLSITTEWSFSLLLEILW